MIRSGSTVIPRIFHRIWFGGGAMPDEFERYGRTWLDCNPGWEMVTWDESNLPTLRNQSAWEGALAMAQRASIARYEILCGHGGVYVDTDFECLRAIEPLLAGATFVAGWQDTRLLCNAWIAATPGHPALEDMITLIPSRVAARPTAMITEQTGPGLFTDVATAHACVDPTVLLYEPHVLYPYHFTEPHRRGERFPEAYAVHHWAKTWGQPQPQRERRRFTAAVSG
jgi:inositol phosphorylceramide mannosyltransferase catalytic subunit